MMARNEKRSSRTVLRVLLAVVGCALCAGGVVLFVASGVRQGNWANVAVFTLPLALLGCALLHVSRRPRRWPLAVAAALLVALVPVGTILWFSANHFGSAPEYEVGSVRELREDLSADCPGIRFPDLARYEGEGAMTCKVLYHGGRLTMRLRSYWILFERSGASGGGEEHAGEGALPLRLSVLSRDMRSFEGSGTPTPRLKSDMVLSGVDVERVGAMLRFVVGDYLYEVSASGHANDDAGDEGAAARREQSFEAAREIALSIIEQ